MSHFHDLSQTLAQIVIPDVWQQQAIQYLLDGRNVILSAPTGAGKTLVFEKVVEAHKFRKRAIYTVPTRALANDKFLEWKTKGWPVGIMTGDISLNTNAPVIVATLEAVMGLITGELQADLLVIDEYQWISDPYRGHHYEAVVIELPITTQLLLMSGSVGNLTEIANWLKKIGRESVIVRHTNRPVPLEEIDGEALAASVPKEIQGFWTRVVAGALREDLGPVLIFVPHRKEAEKLAQQLATRLPPAVPLELTQEQDALLSEQLRFWIKARIGCHHSGLSYAQRAGVIEPLAKAGQLRAVVATLGLSSGINFSLRSVLITNTFYKVDGIDREIPPHGLLQMMGRAGRRGLDERGYVLATRYSAKMSQAREQSLRRSPLLPWHLFLQKAFPHERLDINKLYQQAASLFNTTPPRLGLENLANRSRDAFPCGQFTDTGRARLVRRRYRRFSGCKHCYLREECEATSNEPTMVWQWQRIGLIDYDLRLTFRGRIARCFVGPEGLAIAAAIEEEEYPIDHLVIDLGNLFAADRFCESQPRWTGRLATVCQSKYGRITIEGYLMLGVPWQYGVGAAEYIEEMLTGRKMTPTFKQENLGRGDVDRLITEWHSLLRQIRHAPTFENKRWQALKQWVNQYLDSHEIRTIPSLPPLTSSQKRIVSHVWRSVRM
ncbi:MAG: DEAD/DEAH box helicase [Methylacidiphilales bacterium]|nr:DEAD/DEAH box helicase [Candidatus Methylacidiphilales bacterium]MDW8349858.1 DEAD/DEAH box helicase [Verrucomicrobiae bacterium]